VGISPADILTIDGQIGKTFHILIPRWHLTAVFLNPRAFEAAFVHAMGEPQHEAIAQLCKLLRTMPETLGHFREEHRRRFRREKSPEARTLALRTEIIAARRALNDARAEFVMDAMVGPGPQNSVQAGPQNGVQPAPQDGVRPAEPVQSTPASTAIAFSQMSMSEGSAPQRGKAPTDVMTAVEEIGAGAGGLSEAFRSMVSTGADESLDESVSQLSEELETEASLFADTPDDLAEVMRE
jgi:type IV secretion system protein VirD4